MKQRSRIEKLEMLFVLLNESGIQFEIVFDASPQDLRLGLCQCRTALSTAIAKFSVGVECVATSTFRPCQPTTRLSIDWSLVIVWKQTLRRMLAGCVERGGRGVNGLGDCLFGRAQTNEVGRLGLQGREGTGLVVHHKLTAEIDSHVGFLKFRKHLLGSL